ncbi:transposase, partial [Clostridioides difficile]|nr:transposase [Clostridioides difficile]
MLLTKKIIYNPTELELNVLNSLAFSSARLWNIANYEKKNYKKLGFSEFPNWYEQKKRLKDEFWFKNLPSQTAQDILDKLQKSWKSFFELNNSKGIKNPNPPRFKNKKDLFNFTYLNNGFKIIDDNT